MTELLFFVLGLIIGLLFGVVLICMYYFKKNINNSIDKNINEKKKY